MTTEGKNIYNLCSSVLRDADICRIKELFCSTDKVSGSLFQSSKLITTNYFPSLRVTFNC